MKRFFGLLVVGIFRGLIVFFGVSRLTIEGRFVALFRFTSHPTGQAYNFSEINGGQRRGIECTIVQLGFGNFKIGGRGLWFVQNIFVGGTCGGQIYAGQFAQANDAYGGAIERFYGINYCCATYGILARDGDRFKFDKDGFKHFWGFTGTSYALILVKRFGACYHFTQG